jgi:putative glutamine amidotransferase
VARCPVIGICSAIETARWGAWEALCDLVPRTYSLAVQRAGGLALLIPPDDASAEAPDELLDLLDGLVLAGGSDVDPGSYGARPHPETGATRPERDRFELALGHRALERDLPLLGIGRGMQMLNVISGGTIEQHLPERTGREAHPVRIAPGTLAARVVGSGRADVRSHHHQGIGELGEGIEVSGWSEGGDVIEAIELPERRFALGVLWHPEEGESSRVVAALVKEARERRAP